MAIVMGLDQDRAQITADWLDTDTGEVRRARLTPAHRDDVRQFLRRFAGQRLEVALEGDEFDDPIPGLTMIEYRYPPRQRNRS